MGLLLCNLSTSPLASLMAAVNRPAVLQHTQQVPLALHMITATPCCASSYMSSYWTLPILQCHGAELSINNKSCKQKVCAGLQASIQIPMSLGGQGHWQGKTVHKRGSDDHSEEASGYRNKYKGGEHQNTLRKGV